MKKIIYLLVVLTCFFSYEVVNATFNANYEHCDEYMCMWDYEYIGDKVFQSSGAVFASKEEALKYIPFANKPESYAVMCRYYNDYSVLSGTGQLQGSANNSAHNKFIAKTINILYYGDGKFQVVWNNTSSGFYYEYSSPTNVTAVSFVESSSEGVRADNVVKIADGECPKYAYLDSDGAQSEVCFDSDGKWCEKSDNWDPGTDFGAISSNMDIKYNYYKADFDTRYKEIEAITTAATKYYNDRNKEMKEMLDLNTFTAEEYPSYCDTETAELSTTTHKFNSKNITAINGIYHYAKVVADKEISNYMTGIPNILKYEKYKSGFDTIKENLDKLKTEADSYCTKLRNSLYERGLITQAQNELMNLQQQEAMQELQAAINSFTSGTFISPITVQLNFDPVVGCAGYLGQDTIDLLSKLYSFIKYGCIIVLLVLSIIDFIKAIASQDRDLVMKALIVSAKRMSIGLLIFFLPLLLNVFLNIIGISEGVCGIGVG